MKPTMPEVCAAIVSSALALAVVVLILALGSGLAYRVFMWAAGL